MTSVARAVAAATSLAAVIEVEKKPHPTRSTDREADERFYHFQNVDLELENGRSVGNVTCFVRFDKKLGSHFASFAECDMRDQFNKRTGRVVARRKWFRSPEKRMSIPKEGLNYETLRAKWEQEYMGRWSAHSRSTSYSSWTSCSASRCCWESCSR